MPIKNENIVCLGWREWVSFPDYDNFIIKAKIDSGAKTSALHASHLQQFEKNKKLWVRFRISQSKKNMYISIPVIKYVTVKSSFGDSQNRPLVNIKIKLGDLSWNTNITLAKRCELSYSMLIGRNTLKKAHLINPKMSFMLSKGM